MTTAASGNRSSGLESPDGTGKPVVATIQTPAELSAELTARRDSLLALFRGYGSCAVAFSGGVDSAVVAQAAHVALGPNAVAVTGVSASLAQGELAAAQELAARIGIRHQVLDTGEFAREEYRRNHSDRCFHCKNELYTQLRAACRQWGIQVIVNGANLDDQGDHRPGMDAAIGHGVFSPLIECGLTKNDVRALASHWKLSVWNKPAGPCLSSRIAYGEEATPERVQLIDRAEQYLKACGLSELRVRYHRGDVARIEVPLAALGRLVEPAVREPLVTHFRSLGFKFVTLDLEGLRSGSLNVLVSVDDLIRH